MPPMQSGPMVRTGFLWTCKFWVVPHACSSWSRRKTCAQPMWLKCNGFKVAHFKQLFLKFGRQPHSLSFSLDPSWLVRVGCRPIFHGPRSKTKRRLSWLPSTHDSVQFAAQFFHFFLVWRVSLLLFLTQYCTDGDSDFPRFEGSSVHLQRCNTHRMTQVPPGTADGLHDAL